MIPYKEGFFQKIWRKLIGINTENYDKLINLGARCDSVILNEIGINVPELEEKDPKKIATEVLEKIYSQKQDETYQIQYKFELDDIDKTIKLKQFKPENNVPITSLEILENEKISKTTAFASGNIFPVLITTRIIYGEEEFNYLLEELSEISQRLSNVEINLNENEKIKLNGRLADKLMRTTPMYKDNLRLLKEIINEEEKYKQSPEYISFKQAERNEENERKAFREKLQVSQDELNRNDTINKEEKTIDKDEEQR